MIITKRVSSINESCIPPEGFYSISVMSWHKDNKYHELSPYYLRTDGKEEQFNKGGIIFENFWQGSKVYKTVEPIKEYTHWSKKCDDRYLVWEYDKKETHYNGDNVTSEYWNWREKLYNNDKAVRYPVGRNKRSQCLFSLLKRKDGTQIELGYIQARKSIYLQEYCRLIQQLDVYKEISKLVTEGNNICIFEIDVPSLGKKGFYGAYCNKDGSFVATIDRLEDLLNDSSEAFGHGLCLAYILLQEK